MDDMAAMKIATDFMISKGCRSLAVIAGSIARVSSFAARIRGLAACSDAAQYQVYSTDAIRTQDLNQAAFEIVNQILDSHAAHDGIITVNHMLAMGAYRALTARQIRPGEDLHFTTFDLPDWQQAAAAKIACIPSPMVREAELAIERLIDRIEGKYTAEHEVRMIVPRLIGY